jgi:hypothetical protein
MAYQNAINNRLGNNLLPLVFDLSSSDVLGMFASPVLILPAPGAGLFYGIDYWAIVKGTGTDYADGDNLELIYTASAAALSSIISRTVLTGTGEQIGGTGISNTAIPLASMVNSGISLTNINQAFTTGTAPVRCILKYTLLKVI